MKALELLQTVSKATKSQGRGNFSLLEERKLCISNEELQEDTDSMEKWKEGPVCLGPRATATRLEWTGTSFSSWESS